VALIERLGGLQVRLTGGTDGRGSGDGPVVVLLHGWGAPGDDLVPLGQEIDAPRGTRYVFPEAPLSLQMGFGDSRAWWMLDLEKRQREIAAGRARSSTNWSAASA
jgi:phospholipase/carboxylesterase